ncbi:MAG: DNA-3-methyladenine glycosylase [Phycisphaerales bacterium]
MTAHAPPIISRYRDRSPTPSALTPLAPSFFRRDSTTVARHLLGRYLVREAGASSSSDGATLIMRIVETEAYLGAPDRASHAFDGRRTERNESLYLAGGHAYVYFIYGMHFCMNVVSGRGGLGDAALLRGGEPIAGIEEMVTRRGLKRSPRPGDIAGGPGKLCQALGIDRALDGHSLLEAGALYVTRGEPVPDDFVVTGPRIGVDYAGEAARWPLRFAISGHPEMSRPRLRASR